MRRNLSEWRGLALAQTLLLGALVACSNAEVESFGSGGFLVPGAGTSPDTSGSGGSNGGDGSLPSNGTDPNAAEPNAGDPAGDGTDPNHGPAAPAPRPMLTTQHFDVRRTGANLQEALLTPDAVSNGRFGRIDTLVVDGDVYAQPLYLTQASVAGGQYNVLIVATAHNSVYAFDADAGSSRAALWQQNFNAPIPIADFLNETNFRTEMGIIGTPVVDPNADSIYFVSANKVANTADPNANYAHSLHRIHLSTGAEYPASPVLVAASAPGAGYGTVGGNVSLIDKTNLQRTGLLLANGQVYFGFSAHGITSDYHGWLLAYDATTLQQTGAFVSSPNSAAAGVWQGGQGPALDDAGAVYATTSNSHLGDATQERIESLCKFSPERGLNLVDYFTPSNWSVLDANDMDFGSTGVVLVPGRSLAVNGDKQGNLYFSNTAGLGQLTGDSSGAVHVVSMGPGTAFFSAPVHYAGAQGARVYAWSQNDVLRAWDVSGSSVPSASTDAGPNLGPIYMPGGMLSVSANGTKPGTGIVWATVALGGSASGVVRQGALYAFDADNLHNQLFDSRTQATDALGTLAKFNPPTVAAGRVYVGTFDNKVAVYGLQPVD